MNISWCKENVPKFAVWPYQNRLRVRWTPDFVRALRVHELRLAVLRVQKKGSINSLHGASLTKRSNAIVSTILFSDSGKGESRGQ